MLSAASWKMAGLLSFFVPFVSSLPLAIYGSCRGVILIAARRSFRHLFRGELAAIFRMQYVGEGTHIRCHCYLFWNCCGAGQKPALGRGGKGHAAARWKRSLNSNAS